MTNSDRLSRGMPLAFELAVLAFRFLGTGRELLDRDADEERVRCVMADVRRALDRADDLLDAAPMRSGR